jgi:hypothetical protein
VFAALSYPVASMIAVAVIDVAAYVVAALALGGTAATSVAFVDGELPGRRRDREALHQVADLDLYAVKHGRTRRGSVAGPGEMSWATALARAVDDRMATRPEHSLSLARHAALIGERVGFDDAALAGERAGTVDDVVGVV